MRPLPSLALAIAPLVAAAQMPLHAAANPGFAKLASLVGAWECTLPNGTRATVRYELVSDGSAVLERLSGAHRSDLDMVTVYHVDGPALRLTHFCSAGNQPRMKAEPVAGDVHELRFGFVDATNLASPDEGHMHALVVRFEDADHFTQEWTWRRGGKEGVHTFHWTRVK